MKTLVNILILTLSTISCTQESNGLLQDEIINEGSIQSGVYTSKKFGWSIKIPDSWEIVTSSSELEDIRKMGREMINQAEIDIPQSQKPIQLLFARKNESSIIAIAERITKQNDVSIEVQTYAQKQAITKMYDSTGIPIVESKVDTGIIDGQPCGVARIMVSREPDLFGQLYYVFKRNGHWFSIVITFTNPIDRDEIYESLNGCTFTKL